MVCEILHGILYGDMGQSRIRSGKAIKEKHREKALELIEARSQRSDQEQLKRLDAGGYAAERERERLLDHIGQEQEKSRNKRKKLDKKEK